MVAAMLTGSLGVTPLAALSRPAAGIRGSTVIVNMPGSKKAVKECYGFIQPSLRHAIDLLQNRTKPVKATHAELQGQGGAHVHQCPHNSGGGGPNHDTGDGTVPGRVRQSTWPMITVKQAQDQVFQECKKLMNNIEGVQVMSVETIDFRECVGRVLA